MPREKLVSLIPGRYSIGLELPSAFRVDGRSAVVDCLVPAPWVAKADLRLAALIADVSELVFTVDISWLISENH